MASAACPADVDPGCTSRSANGSACAPVGSGAFVVVVVVVVVVVAAVVVVGFFAAPVDVDDGFSETTGRRRTCTASCSAVAPFLAVVAGRCFASLLPARFENDSAARDERCVIVILTVKDDVYVPDIVADAVRARGVDVVRVDSDEFAGAGFSVSSDGDHFDVLVNGEVLDASCIWARRRWPGARSAVVDEFRAGAAAQARVLFHSWLRARGDDVKNDVDAEDRAEDKLLQLRTARRLGFTIPATLVSNDPARVRDFCTGNDVVTKLLAPLSSSFAATDAFFYTSVVDDQALRHIAEVAHAPQIFQRRVDKVRELRVQVVGALQDGQVFCGALDADSTDWRLQQSGRWTAYALSPATTARCLALCRALALDTGAIDLVVDHVGVEHFLEINPAGEWGFLERDCGLPIANALADLLTR